MQVPCFSSLVARCSLTALFHSSSVPHGCIALAAHNVHECVLLVANFLVDRQRVSKELAVARSADNRHWRGGPTGPRRSVFAVHAPHTRLKRENQVRTNTRLNYL